MKNNKNIVDIFSVIPQEGLSPITDVSKGMTVVNRGVVEFKTNDYLDDILIKMNTDVDSLFTDKTYLLKNAYNIICSSKDNNIIVINKAGKDITIKNFEQAKNVINNDTYVLQKLFLGSYIKISSRQFKRLAMIKTIGFTENLISGVLEDNGNISQDPELFTKYRDGVLISGPSVIQDLCNYLYEYFIRSECVSDLNDGLSWFNNSILYYEMSDVYIELITGDKVKMSFQHFLAMYSNIVKGVENIA